MAFGINRSELIMWKEAVLRSEIAFLTHYWFDERFPQYKTVTKVGCSDLHKLRHWCFKHQLNPDYIHHHDQYPYYDLMGPRQQEILQKEGQWEQIERFELGI